MLRHIAKNKAQGAKRLLYRMAEKIHQHCLLDTTMKSRGIGRDIEPSMME